MAQVVLVMHSGPADSIDSLPSRLRARGIVVAEMDTLNTAMPNQDITDGTVWGDVLQDLMFGVYSFVASVPPCRTFCVARDVGQGPPEVRDRRWPEGFFGSLTEHKVWVQWTWKSYR